MHINTQSGFSLIQLSIVIIIVSLGLGAAAMLASVQYKKDQQTKLIESFDDTNELMLAFYTGVDASGTPNERLPCPARRDLPIDDANFGREDCSAVTIVNSTINHPDTGNPMRVMIGALPVKALSVTTESAFDVFGGQLLYAVSEDMVSNTNFARNDLASILRVEQVGGAPIGQPLPFIVISAGDTGRGTYSTNGTLIEACPNNVAETENCNNDAIFLDSTVKEQATSGEFNDDRVGFDGTFASRVANTIIANATCPAGQYLTGIQDGVPNCEVVFVTIASCPSGEYLTGIANNQPQCNGVGSTTTTTTTGNCPNAENNGAQCVSGSCYNCSDRGDSCVGAMVCGVCTGGTCISGNGSR